MFQWLVEHYVPAGLGAVVGALVFFPFVRSLTRTSDRVIFGTLYAVGWSCLVLALFLAQHGHQLSGVPTNHVVYRDTAGYYYKPTGPFDIRYPLSERRASVYYLYENYSTWLGVIGGATWLISILLGAWLHRRENARNTARVPAGSPAEDLGSRNGGAE